MKNRIADISDIKEYKIPFGTMKEYENESIFVLDKEINENIFMGMVINKPEYVELNADSFEDRIEFKAINTKTNKSLIKPFYFNKEESPAMSNLKRILIVENLIKEVMK